ncbi:site-specific DNA-methyltransferase, partial [bacterium]|nr:site-specific DNA-methyltransferase [bacterium]
LFDGDSPFDTPKPLGLLRKIITMSSSSDDIVMDLFAGSCTTAQAVLEQNRDDQSNRRFIMVQIPHVRNTNEPNLVEIGKERISRVIQRMVDERNGKLEGFEQHPDEDLGFRVFKLDSSAMRQWEELPASTTTPEEYARQLEMFVKDPLLEGWTIDDVIAEVAIKETGFSLSYRVEQVAEVTALTVYRVIDDEKEQFFYICLDDKLSLDALKPLDLQRDDLLIFRDSAVTDTIVANLVLTCRIKSI